jgi:hypothetical protein
MSSNYANVVRGTGAAALAVALLYFLSVPVGSLTSMPATDAPAPEVLRWLTEHRTGVLACVVMNGVAWCAVMPLVFVGLRELLGPPGGVAATVALACALVTAAAIGVLLVFAALAAYSVPDIDAPLAKLLSDGSSVATTASAWPTVPTMLATALALRRARALPRAAVGLALASAAIECVSGVSLARAGALSPSGIGLLAPMVFSLWLTVVGVALLRHAAAATAHAPAAA